MFDNVIFQLNAILNSCDTMCYDNIPEKLSEIRAAIAVAKLELEELEFQANGEA